ncbi:transcriptional regulator [Frondihabitans sucicola]|uniref:Transcriptional regulator n=1 Tax=Frondihabitans sucicola TaxID=1268041 RepID=A0ABN6XTK3_9MICO|nr:MarR family winged helix-turn-helix transcriptional regulator [Frondihabitans sucicola]BDZ48311.1 transcriptional regulator [Frondihabitans sucicola]
MTLDRTSLPTPAGSDVSDEIDRLERQFGVLFDAYRQRLRQRSGDLDPALQPSGYRCVFTLVVDGPMGASPLADLLGFDKSVLSRQLHQLEELGLVSRAQDPADRRAVIISATPAAVERVEAIRSTDRDAFRARLAAWDRRDLDALTRLLAKLGEL